VKCLLCPAEIDELKEFPDVMVGGRPLPDDIAKAKHAEALSTWEQVTVSVLRDGGNKQLLVGMTCPSDRLDTVTISKGGK
jgi:hypothetical protein